MGVLTVIPLVKYLLYWWKAPDLGRLRVLKPLIADLVDTIIPSTDTGGARHAGVADFVIGKIEFFLEHTEQHIVIDGLNELERLMLKRYGKPFGSCATEEREEALNFLEQKDLDLHPLLAKLKYKLFGYSFIGYLKAYTIEGFCTSELGATTCLRYLPFPIRYEPCVDMATIECSWATK